jgi:Putative auto-transporter adhesin, head GIN domain
MLRRRDILDAGSLLVAGLSLPTVPAVAAPEPQRRWDIGPFSAVKTDLAADIVLAPASAPSVVAQAEAKVLERLRVEVRNGSLSIEATGNFQTQRGVTVRIGYVALEKLHVGGTAEVKLQGPRAGNLELHTAGSAGLEASGLELQQGLRAECRGSGTIRLAGRAPRVVLSASGSGDLFAAALASDDVLVRASGSATVEVAARTSLDVVVADAATVRYKGRPRISQKVGDAGTLEAMG